MCVYMYMCVKISSISIKFFNFMFNVCMVGEKTGKCLDKGVLRMKEGRK